MASLISVTLALVGQTVQTEGDLTLIAVENASFLPLTIRVTLEPESLYRPKHPDGVSEFELSIYDTEGRLIESFTMTPTSEEAANSLPFLTEATRNYVLVLTPEDRFGRSSFTLVLDRLEQAELLGDQETDQNNSKAQATQISLDETYQGMIGHFDVDWFRFDSDHDGFIQITYEVETKCDKVKLFYEDGDSRAVYWDADILIEPDKSYWLKLSNQCGKPIEALPYELRLETVPRIAVRRPIVPDPYRRSRFRGGEFGFILLGAGAELQVRNQELMAGFTGTAFWAKAWNGDNETTLGGVMLAELSVQVRLQSSLSELNFGLGGEGKFKLLAAWGNLFHLGGLLDLGPLEGTTMPRTGESVSRLALIGGASFQLVPGDGDNPQASLHLFGHLGWQFLDRFEDDRFWQFREAVPITLLGGSAFFVSGLFYIHAAYHLGLMGARIEDSDIVLADTAHTFTLRVLVSELIGAYTLSDTWELSGELRFWDNRTYPFEFQVSLSWMSNLAYRLGW